MIIIYYLVQYDSTTFSTRSSQYHVCAFISIHAAVGVKTKLNNGEFIVVLLVRNVSSY